MIYLDNAATTLPKPETVSRAVFDAILNMGSLGRGSHEVARSSAETAFLCRQLAGTLFDLPPDCIAFTLNTTHALNIAIKTLVKPGDHVVVSGFEHNAVMRPLYALGADVSIAGRILFDAKDTVASFEAAITPGTSAVICTHVSNVFGYILPIKEIAKICKEREVPLIVDAAQSAGALPLSVRALGAAFVAVPGHKGLFGPQGTGLLLCGQLPKPLMEGGTGSWSKQMSMPDFLPDRVEAGTQNIHGIAGLCEGLKFVISRGVDGIQHHEAKLMDLLRKELNDNAKYRTFFGEQYTQSGVLSFVPIGMSCEETARLLDRAGFAVRSGYHCAPVAHESAKTSSSGTVRVSLSAFSTENDVEALASFLRELK